MKTNIFIAFLVPFMLSCTNAEPVNVSYSIIAPKVFRPGSPYRLTAVCFNAVDDVDLTLRLNSSGNSTLVEHREILTNGEAKTIALQVPSAVPGDQYDLVVVGTGGLNFADKHSVKVYRKTLILFVQTDKATYKPSQTVLFRVIALHPDLKPYKDLMDIAIYDVAGNKIMQWLKQKNNTGVISQRLQLSDQTPLGDWKITVTAGDNLISKTFEVAEYVLPKFEVTLTLPSFFLVNLEHENRQEDLQFAVSAKYTYGQMVKGMATVSVQMQKRGWYEEYYVSFPKKVMVLELKNGKADIKMGIKDLLDIVPLKDRGMHLSSRNIIVSASVEETVSGIILSSNGTVPCKSEKHSLKFLSSSPKNFKPGLQYTGFLHLSKADGGPPDSLDIVQPDGIHKSIVIGVSVKVQRENDESRRYFWPHEEILTRKTISVVITTSGYMKFSLAIENNASSVDLEASFVETTTKKLISATTTIRSFKSRDNQNIQISFMGLHGTIKVPEVANFSVVSTQPVASFQYEMMSKGDILMSETVVGSVSNHHSFSLEITKDLAVKLAPTARIVVWLFTSGGEIVTDSTEVSVSSTLENEVTLSFDRESATPSENVTLTVRAHSESYVGLLAVDQSVLLLKSGNDISQETVFQELNNFDGAKVNGHDRYKRSMMWPFFIDGSNSQQILHNSGLFILTDGYIHVHKDEIRRVYYDSPVKSLSVGKNGGLREKSEMMDSSRAKAAIHDSSSDNVVEDLIVTRVKFPETWLWIDAFASANGSVTLQTSIPDTITSWIANAFAVSDSAGLGIAPTTAKLTVFKQFFISHNLPYSIIRGEEFALQINVFNYLSLDLDVLVMLEESEYFTVANASKQIVVKSDDAVAVYFWIVAKSLGSIPIDIKALSPLASDAMRATLLVKPEGVQEQYSTSVFMQVSSSDPPLSRTLSVSLPPKNQLVPGSEYIEITVVGDIMGPSVKGLDNLLKMPYGCGEQNMLNFAPDVYIVKYLSISDELMPELKSKALNFMNLGYQRELTYQRSDGSFSAFGNQDKAGSVWLSAFVIKCFHQAQDYIAVDDGKIAETMNWIMSNQASDGSFSEPPLGRVIHADMQGGSSRGLSMTAYVLNALLENVENEKVDAKRLKNCISLALAYLERRLLSVTSDPYALSIIAYAMARADSSKANDVLIMLENLAKIEAGTKHWEKKADIGVDTSYWTPPYSQSKAVNIEMTSYVLLTFCYRKDMSSSLPIVKWIIAQRNANGGFSSTQDTVMALEALAEFASMIAGSSGNGSLDISVIDDQSNKVHNFLPVTQQTSILLQSYQLPSKTTKVDITASGKGSALVQLNVLFNVYHTYNFSGISLRIDTRLNRNGVDIKSCGRWTRNEKSGMVVMEVSQLTGFKVSNIDKLKSEENDVIKRVENKDDKVILYFDEFTSNEVCVKIISEKILPVSNIQDASIKVYPYYDPSEARTMFYQAPMALRQNSVCDECPECCGLKPRKGVGSNVKILSVWMVIGSLVIHDLICCI